jgi:antirestriction protein
MTNSAQTNTTYQADNTPAIYAANLRAYNEGELLGVWIPIAEGMTGDEIRAKIQEMLDWTNDEEYAIHDYSNFPSSLGEWPDLDTVAEIAQAIHEHGYDLVKGYVDYFDADQLDQLGERYSGTYDSEEDFAHDLVRDCYDLEKTMGSLASYFDYEAFARDLFMGDYVSIDVPEGVAVFRND